MTIQHDTELYKKPKLTRLSVSRSTSKVKGTPKETSASSNEKTKTDYPTEETSTNRGIGNNRPS